MLCAVFWPDMLCVSPEELRRSDSQGLLETLHKGGCVGRRRETGEMPHITHHTPHRLYMAYTAAASHRLLSASVSCFQTCNRCKARRKCTKRFSIQKFPQILVLRILSSLLCTIFCHSEDRKYFSITSVLDCYSVKVAMHYISWDDRVFHV